ncbi:uncharacterized protein TNCV_5110711 [Trichonephila clavipes]|nr:uncharacterized protein TNCV_5110711 [Trichonephila clavipes]
MDHGGAVVPMCFYLRKPDEDVDTTLLFSHSVAQGAGGIIGPYFFKNDEGHDVTVNGDRYQATITNFFIPELNNHDVQELWFQEDGATCHTARATIDLLKDTFGDRLISRFRPVNWPPRSCDLTPLDYFLWGYVKSLVYADKPQTLDHLEDNIRRVVADIRPEMLEKVIENWTSRLDYIRASRSSHMPEIILKILVKVTDLWPVCHEFKPSTAEGPSHIIITAEIESGFNAEDDLIPFCYSRISFEHETDPDGDFDELVVTGCTHNGCYNSDCCSARCLAMVQSDSEARSEGAACVDDRH